MYSTMGWQSHTIPAPLPYVKCEKKKNISRSLTHTRREFLLPSSKQKMRLQRLTRKPPAALARPSSERARSLAPAAASRGGPRPRAASPPPPRGVATVSPPADFQSWAGADIKKRTDIKSIMILGAGPIVIGQVRGMAVAEREKAAGRAQGRCPNERARLVAAGATVDGRTLAGVQAVDSERCLAVVERSAGERRRRARGASETKGHADFFSRAAGRPTEKARRPCVPTSRPPPHTPTQQACEFDYSGTQACKALK